MERVRKRVSARGDATCASMSLDLPAVPALKSSPVTEAGGPHGTCHSQSGTEVSQSPFQMFMWLAHYSSFRISNVYKVLCTTTDSGSEKDDEVVRRKLGGAYVLTEPSFYSQLLCELSHLCLTYSCKGKENLSSANEFIHLTSMGT